VATENDPADAFRDARFTGADFTGATFRDCDLRRVKITDSWLVDVNVSGLVGNFVVNDVDVTAFVEGELDRRHPERAQLRAMQTADDYRAMWAAIERLWSDTVARTWRLPESALHLRVDDEWSFVETLRHLIFATDAWVGRTIADEPMPYDPIGLTYTGYPAADAAAIGIDLDARPSLAVVLDVRENRTELVRAILEGLTDADLDRVCPRLPAPGYPEETRTVGRCLRVVMNEEIEHRRYAVRDLAALEADLEAARRSDLPSLFVDRGQREGWISKDVRGLDAHQVIAAAAQLRVGSQPVSMPEPGAFQLVSHAPGIGESRLFHPDGQVLAECRFRLAGKIVRRVVQHSAADGDQLIQLVGGKVKMVRDPGTHAGIGLEEIVHAVLIAREDYHQLVPVILHYLEQDIDALLAVVL
jgi:hypothetical protein